MHCTVCMQCTECMKRIVCKQCIQHTVYSLHYVQAPSVWRQWMLYTVCMHCTVNKHCTVCMH